MAQLLRLGGASSMGALPEIVQILLGGLERRLAQLFQKAFDGGHIRRHLAGQAEGGKTTIAKQPGLFLP